MAKKRSDL